MGILMARSRSVARSGIRPTYQKSSKTVPDQWAAELRPKAHGAGIGEHVKRHPRPAGMDERENTGAGHREKRHGLGKSIDGGAPLLIQQEKNRGDQRAGMPDTDPPDEIHDGEAPSDGDVNSPDASALGDEPAERNGQHADNAEGDRKADKPAQGNRARQNDGADLVRDRAVGMPRPKHRREAPNFRRIEWRLPGAHAFSSSGFGLRTAARYVVRGRVFSSPRSE